MKRYRHRYQLTEKISLEDGTTLELLLNRFFVRPMRSILIYLYNKEINEATVEDMKKAEKEIKDAMKEFGQWVFNNTELKK